MTVASRAAALVAWPARATDRLVGAIIWFAPRGVPWAVVVAALLSLAALRSIDDAHAEIDAGPRPEPVPLVDVVDLRETGWVGTSSIVRGPFLDSTAYGAPIQRWYYLIVDPRDEEVAMVARSTERLERRRTRTIVARVVLDPAAVSSALAGLDAGTLRVDRERYLIERADLRPRTLIGDAIASPTGAGLDATDVIMRGSFGVARAAADGDGWEYLAREGGRAVVVRSPYPPEALPVDVWGVATTDPVRAEQAAAVPALREALGDRRLPPRHLLAEGVTPPLPEVSFVPAMVLLVLAALLVIGWLLGYPIFRRERLPEAVRTWPLRAGDEVSADLHGRDSRGPRAVVADGAPASLARFAPDELERRSWQFALRDAPGVAPVAAGAASSAPGILALTSGEGPILLRLDPPPPGMQLVSGTVVHARRQRPALRIRAAGIDLAAAFASTVDRDRALVAILPNRLAGVPEGEPPRAQPMPRPAPGGDGLPVPLRTAALALAAVGALFIAGGAIGMPDAISGRSEIIASLAQLLIGIGLLSVGRGVWLRRDWARSVGFTVGWVGAAISAFLVIAAPQCGLWLSPNLAACQAVGPVGSAAALVATVGLAYAALAIRRHGAAFVR